jgi:trans-2,3-dihydro-3-hydroxyanthranilate isomerase
VGNPFYIVDVFAEQQYQGNQLAVVRCAEPVDDTRMQQIASEMHFSETSFILSHRKRKGGYDVRIFTPAAEVPFAGHPTLGTAYVIQQEIIGKPVEAVLLNLKVGQTRVTFDSRARGGDLLWLRHPNPAFSDVLVAEDVARAAGIKLTAIDGRLPVQEVSTGLPFIIVPMNTLEDMQGLTITEERCSRLVKGHKAGGVLFFSSRTSDPRTDLHVRVFAHGYGVPEDPATGSAAGCLAAYLVRHRYGGKSEITLRAEQGLEIGRPSLLHLHARQTGGQIQVDVGGLVQPVARGTLD